MDWYHLLAYWYEGSRQGARVRSRAKEADDIDGSLIGEPFAGYKRGALGQQWSFSTTSVAKKDKWLIWIPQHIALDTLATFFAAVKDFHRIVTSMQMLKDLSYYLPLCTGVFLAHGPIHELNNILIEVRNEMIQILLMRFYVQALATDPLHSISKSRKLYSYDDSIL